MKKVLISLSLISLIACERVVIELEEPIAKKQLENHRKKINGIWKLEEIRETTDEGVSYHFASKNSISENDMHTLKVNESKELEMIYKKNGESMASEYSWGIFKRKINTPECPNMVQFYLEYSNENSNGEFIIEARTKKKLWLKKCDPSSSQIYFYKFVK